LIGCDLNFFQRLSKFLDSSSFLEETIAFILISVLLMNFLLGITSNANNGSTAAHNTYDEIEGGGFLGEML
jgi:hypothetical protein